MNRREIPGADGAGVSLRTECASQLLLLTRYSPWSGVMPDWSTAPAPRYLFARSLRPRLRNPL